MKDAQCASVTIHECILLIMTKLLSSAGLETLKCLFEEDSTGPKNAKEGSLIAGAYSFMAVRLTGLLQPHLYSYFNDI